MTYADREVHGPIIAALIILLTPLTGNSLTPESGAAWPPKTAEEVFTHFGNNTRDTLQKKGVVLLDQGREDGMTEGLILFDQPMDRIWHLLSQGERQTEYRPELKNVHVIENSPGYSLDEHELRIMFISLVYRLRFDFDRGQSRIAWSLDPDFENDVDHISGNWYLFPIEDGRTLGLFGTRVRVGPALPGWLQNSVSRKKIPETLKRCRIWAESNKETGH